MPAVGRRLFQQLPCLKQVHVLLVEDLKVDYLKLQWAGQPQQHWAALTRPRCDHFTSDQACHSACK